MKGKKTMYKEQIEQIQHRIQTLTDALHGVECMLANQLALIFNRHLIDGVAQTTIVDGRAERPLAHIDLEDGDGNHTALTIDYSPKDELIFYGNVSNFSYSSKDLLQLAKVYLACNLVANEAQMTALFNGFVKDVAPIKDAYAEANGKLYVLQGKQRQYEREQIANGLSEGDWYVTKGGYPNKMAFRVVRITPKKASVITYVTSYSTAKGIHWIFNNQHFWQKDVIASNIFNGVYVKETLPAELA